MSHLLNAEPFNLQGVILLPELPWARNAWTEVGQGGGNLLPRAACVSNPVPLSATEAALDGRDHRTSSVPWCSPLNSSEL